MKFSEIESLFVSGEIMVVTFGIRNMYFNIGSHKITEKQYNNIKIKYKGRTETKVISIGITKHFTKLIK